MLSRDILAGAERHPTRTAVLYNDQPVSWGAFASAIERVAALIVGRGYGGDGVAVLAISHLLDAWVIGLGLREAGLSVFPTLGAADIAAATVRDVRLVVSLADEGWPGLAEICERRGWPLARLSRADLDERVRRWSGAATPGGHILRTSGTTGGYKGVLMAPAFERSFLARRAEVFGINEASMVAVFGFGPWTGVGYKGAGAAWSTGATVVINQGRPARHGLSPADLTHAHLAPLTVAELIAESPGALPRRPAMMFSVAAGAILEAQAQAVRERITPALYSSLGSTEAMTFALTRLDSPEDRRWHRPVAGRDLELVDDKGAPVASGDVGRIRVSTAGGPTEYLDDPAASAAFFSAGWFYPGDLAVIRADGRFALQGRTTDVISHRGVKIAPAPIEDALRERLGVSGVCLFSAQNHDAEEEIHVVLEARSPLPLDDVAAVIRDEIRGFPRARLHYVAALPRTGLGKVLRNETRRLVLGA